MAKKTNLKHGEARLEFVACRERIEEMLNKGHSISSIHRILHENEIITMSYKTLQDKINKIFKAPQGTASVKHPVPPQASHLTPAVQSGVKLAELDAAMEEASAKRGGARKKGDDANPADGRKDVIG